MVGGLMCSTPSCSSSSPKYVVKSTAPNESRSSSSNLSDSGPLRLKCTAIEASSIPFSAGKGAKVGLGQPTIETFKNKKNVVWGCKRAKV